MCGIAGFFNPKYLDKNIAEKHIKKMTAALHHRGPDNEDYFINDEISFGHSRLSILELSKHGNQPKNSFSGRYTITFNGEIYNHSDLRYKLKCEGHNIQWFSNSDTETLVNLFEFWDLEKILNSIVGMFAFALWDSLEKKMILSRDRFGEKPLFYAWVDNNFIFSSELNSIKQFPKFDKSISGISTEIYFKINYIPAPLTIYKNCFKLEPSTFLIIKNNLIKNFQIKKNQDIETDNFIKKKWWTVSNNINTDIPYIEKVTILKNALKKSIKRQTISDVGFASFLSGGVDSSLIAFLMKEEGIENINTYSISVNDRNYDESDRAKKIAKILNYKNYCIDVTSKDISDFLPRIKDVYGEPFADSSQIPTFILSKFVSKENKVAITGDGGDEIFSGYIRHIWGDNIYKIFSKFPHSLRKNISKFLLKLNINKIEQIEKVLNLFLSENQRLVQLDKKIIKVGSLLERMENIDSYYFNLLSIWPNASKYKNENLHEQIGTNLLTSNIANLDIDNYLHDDVMCKVDRASMANSLETRAPFLDYEVFKASRLFSKNEMIHKGVGKMPLRFILNKYLPEELRKYPKKGFGLPLNNWLRGELKVWVNDILSSSTSLNQDFLDMNTVNYYWNMHVHKKKNYGEFLWNAVVFLDWVNNE